MWYSTGHHLCRCTYMREIMRAALINLHWAHKSDCKLNIPNSALHAPRAVTLASEKQLCMNSIRLRSISQEHRVAEPVFVALPPLRPVSHRPQLVSEHFLGFMCTERPYRSILKNPVWYLNEFLKLPRAWVLTCRDIMLRRWKIFRPYLKLNYVFR